MHVYRFCIFLMTTMVRTYAAEALEGTLDSWNLDASRQVCITTDNGSDIVSVTTTHLDWTRLSCFGHRVVDSQTGE